MKTTERMKIRGSTPYSSASCCIPHSGTQRLRARAVSLGARTPHSEDPTAFTVGDTTPEYRPWGNFRTLGSGPGYKIKRLVVQPGQRLSLQKHRRRAEHWVVVSGTATIVRGEGRLSLRERGCAVIPRGAWHRIENHGRKPVVVIEVQHGPYLGEDDIVRRQDDYGRMQRPRTMKN